jgi:signal transduction histidine kinase
MSRSLYIFMLIGSYLGITLCGNAQQNVEVKENARLLIGDYVEFLVDSSGVFNANEVQTKHYSRSSSTSLNLGIIPYTVWLRFSIYSKGEGYFYMEIMSPLLEKIEVYKLSSETLQPIFKGGFNNSFDQRIIKSENYILPLYLKKDSVYTYYIKCRTSFNFQVPIALSAKEQFIENNQLHYLFWGIYTGIMIFALIYNLFIYISVRERRYLYYILYIIGSTTFYLSIEGFAFQFFWPTIPSINQHIVVLICLTNIVVALFALNFLKIDKRQKLQFYFGIGIIFVFSIIALINIFGSYAASVGPAQIMSLIICVYCIYIGFKSFKRGIHSARYFLIAWTLFLTFVILFILTINGLVTSNFFTSHCIFIGHMTEVMLLSFALADRINALKSENEKFQKELMSSQQEIQEQTFQSISQEIHDNICQVLAVVKLNMNTLSLRATKPDAEKIVDSKALLSKVIQDLRDLSKSLNTDFINKIGLEEAVKQQLSLLEKTGYYGTQMQMEGEAYKLSAQHELVVFRIVQELLQNIVKHAEATFIKVKISYDTDKLIIQVEDNGKGFQPESIGSSKYNGIGLQNIENRIKVLKGLFAIQSQRGNGVIITLTLPKSNI